MIAAYTNGQVTEHLDTALWIDLLNPTEDELRRVESVLGVELPSKQEAEEIETSSRLYRENDTLFMIATVMLNTDSAHPTTTPVTFVYQSKHLVTVRFADPRPFPVFQKTFKKLPADFSTSQQILLGIFDEIIDRVADVLEGVGADLTKISEAVFVEPGAQGEQRSKHDEFTSVLARIGRNGLRAANARESLVSLNRVVAFFSETIAGLKDQSPDRYWRSVVERDILSLSDHATFLSNKVNFFLDATLGRISNEQNTIIKLFSVLAVVFLPPTLIASIYGMNFEHMPELKWRLGYPVSVVLMIAFAILPYFIFKKKRWL